MPKSYNMPHALLDALIEHAKLRNDADLARHLHCTAAVISKIRNERIHVTDDFRMRVMRITGWSLKRVDTLAPPRGSDDGVCAD